MMEQKDKRFRELFQSYKPVKAPSDFSKNVMDEIFKQVSDKVYQPVFGRWFLPSFGLVIFLFITYAISTIKVINNIETHGQIHNLFSNIQINEIQPVKNIVSVITKLFNQIPSLVWIILFTSLVLVLVNWILLSIKHQRVK